MSILHISELPEAQKCCLRLIFQGYEIKEIGIHLKISHYTVTERLRAARRSTNTQNSMETARLLAVHEGLVRNIQYVNSPTVIPQSANPVPFTNSSMIQLESAGNECEDIAVHEDQVSYSPAPMSRSWQFPLPFPTQGKTYNDMTFTQTILIIPLVALTIGLASIAILAMLEELTRLLTR